MKYVYWDTNCFLALLQDERPMADEVMGVAQEAGKSLWIVTSAFTITEVVKHKNKETGTIEYPMGPDERIPLDQCFGRENGVLIVNVDVAVARMAREAIWDHGVDPKDAVHVGSAMYFKNVFLKTEDTYEFHTFDKRLAKRADGADGIRFVEPTREMYPYQDSFEIGM